MKRLAVLVFLSAGLLAQGVPFPYHADLSWTLSTSAITGQNVYRAPWTTACGTFAALTTTPLSATAVSYSDTTVAPNGAYCYEVTAVNAAGKESSPSTPVTNIQIPPAPDTNLAATVN
jgi:hypothetical protein